MVQEFQTTSWSLVLTARDATSSIAREALNALCRTYWPPLYAHVRSKGYGLEDAGDLTQAFFCHLLEQNFLRHVDRERGRFRTFLLASLDNFLVSEWHHGNRQKRGGGGEFLSLDFAAEERALAAELARNPDPTLLFDRRWAQTLLDSVVARLRDEFASAGKSDLFDQLRDCLSVEREHISYRTLAARLGMSEGAVKVGIHRMRRRYAALLREEVARTVDGDLDVEEELRYLVQVLGRNARDCL